MAKETEGGLFAGVCSKIDELLKVPKEPKSKFGTTCRYMTKGTAEYFNEEKRRFRSRPDAYLRHIRFDRDELA